MHEWITAPLLAVDPTGAPLRQPERDGTTPDTARPAGAGERRGGDRRDTHKDDSDADFGRGEDRRGDVV